MMNLVDGRVDEALRRCTSAAARRADLEEITRAAAALRIAPDAKLTTWYRSGDAAKAVVRAKTVWRTDEGMRSLAIDVRLDAEGTAWLIQAVRDAYDYVQAELIKAAEAAERESVLQANAELIDPTIALQIRRAAEKLSIEGKHDDALRAAEAALAVGARLNAHYELGYGYLTRGSVYKRRIEWNRALADYEKARIEFVADKDKEGEAKTQSRAASIYTRVGLHTKAIVFYENALRLFREIKDDNAEADALQDIGAVLKDLGRPEEALQRNTEARLIRQRRGETRRDAILMANEAGLLSDLGRYGPAVALFYKAIEILREHKDSDSLGYALNNLATTLDELGRLSESRESLQEAQAAFRAVGNHSGEWMATHNLAGLLARLGIMDQALELGLEAARLAEQLDERRYQSQTDGLLQEIMLETNEYAQALALTEGRLEAARATGNRVQEASAHLVAGFALTGLDRLDEAKIQFDAAAKIADSLQSRLLQRQTWRGYGKIAEKRKEWPAAAYAYGCAISAIEKDRYSTQEQSLQTSFLRLHIPIYRSWIRALLESGRIDEAYFASERAKARGLVDMLRDGRIDLSRSMSADQRQRARELDENLKELSARAEQTVVTDELDALTTAIQKAQKEIDDFRIALYLERPDLEARSGEFAPASLQEIASALFRTAPSSAIVTYTFIDEKCHIFVLRRTKSGAASIHHVVSPMRTSRIYDQADRLWREIMAHKPTYRGAARALYTGMIGPVETLLAGKTHLIISTDVAMPDIPFIVLLDARGRPLIERRSVSYAPSVTALVRMVQDARSRGRRAAGLLAVGAPKFGPGFSPLPATADEVRRVSATMRHATTLIGASATQERVIEAINRVRYIHFATHGVLDERSPMQSAVVLSPSATSDGRLTARDLARQDLKADLVVLSACETARGKRVNGEGILGLTWALFIGGTSATIASQWQVADTSTRTLMVEFYRRLSSGSPSKLSTAEALRQAQLAVARDPRYRHPYYWAPFILTGNWLR
ncbi:MAG: CHAT domain-containing protein [Chthonomonadales bacterium]|nr:CHAT domain-containing protein [Chthonomonadales bacterium]